MYVFYACFRCDADPGDLSKYVLALIKKKRTSDEMKESLDVFLQVSYAKSKNYTQHCNKTRTKAINGSKP